MQVVIGKNIAYYIKVNHTGKAWKTQLELDPLALNWSLQEHEYENKEHIKRFTETKIIPETTICCHPNYRGIGSQNEYIMVKYSRKQASILNDKFVPTKLVTMFAEPTEKMNNPLLHLTHILVQDIGILTQKKNQLSSHFFHTTHIH